MKRKNFAFLLALALAVGTALGLGWLRQDRREPAARQTLGAQTAVEVRGQRFTLVSFGEVDLPEKTYYQQVPAGAVWLRLVLQQEVIALPAELDDIYCSIELVTDQGRWDSDTSTATAANWRSSCTGNYQEPPLQVGDQRELVGLWLVPESVLVNPRALIQFTAPPAAFEVQLQR